MMSVLIKSLFFLVLFSSGIAFSQSKINFTDSQGLKQGPWEEVIDSTKQVICLEKANYLNDTLHGSYLVLENEKITYEAMYFKGNLIGYERFYNLNGSLERIVHRQNESIDFDLMFSSGGNPKKESYFVNGQLYNTRDYYSNGRIRLISYYLDNKLEGKQYYYKKNGKVRMIIEYDKGREIMFISK